MKIANGSSFQLTNSSLDVSTDELTISQQDGSTPLLSISDVGVNIGAPQMEVTHPLGVTIRGPLETPQVQAPANQDLQIQSLSGGLRLAGEHVTIQDGVRFEGVEVVSQDTLLVSSQNDQVRW